MRKYLTRVADWWLSFHPVTRYGLYLLGAAYLVWAAVYVA